MYQNLAGIGTGIVVTAVSSLILWDSPMFWESMLWQGLILITLVTLGCSRHNSSMGKSAADPTSSERIAFWALPAIVFGISWRFSVDVYFIYTIIWMAYAPIHMPWKQCWYWLLVINIGWYFVRLLAWGDSHPLVGTLLVLTFHVFALISARAAQQAELSNTKTQELNRELLATQHLLAESSRERERTRIARDLHDLLGHHMTALSINLQVASHLSEGEVKEKVDQCYGLAKLLLGDVRDAVATLREVPVLKLKELIEIAVRDIPRLKIQVQIPEDLTVENVDIAEVLLRIVQEAITNTLKHSGANSAYVKANILSRSDKNRQIVLEYHDDGRGCQQLVQGHGLKGMQERIDRVNGELHIESTPHFSIRAVVPSAE